MSPLEALRTARRWGIQIVRRDGYLDLYDRMGPPPTSVWRALSEHKDAIMALLTPDASGWTGEDYENFFEERAAILEYEHDVPRKEAEARARIRTDAERTLRLAHCGKGLKTALTDDPQARH
jgi:hypothetical protein